MMPALPSCNQTWSHSTCSIEKMSDAVSDNKITAIEADIVMGFEIVDDVDDTGDKKNKMNHLVPIMAHPPDRESDLSFERFTNHACKADGLKKHLKLDFKEIEAVKPCLQILINRKFMSNGKIIWLNADIIPGPGKSQKDIDVPANEFLIQCLTVSAKNRQLNFALSIGFKVDVCSVFGHSQQHVAEMTRLITAHKLHESFGIVLAVNARLLSKNMTVFDTFLESFSNAQLLCWVGSGEPPISFVTINKIRAHFLQHGSIDRVGFDVQTTHFLMGAVYDIIILAIGIYRQIKASVTFKINSIN